MAAILRSQVISGRLFDTTQGSRGMEGCVTSRLIGSACYHETHHFIEANIDEEGARLAIATYGSQ